MPKSVVRVGERVYYRKAVYFVSHQEVMPQQRIYLQGEYRMLGVALARWRKHAKWLAGRWLLDADCAVQVEKLEPTLNRWGKPCSP